MKSVAIRTTIPEDHRLVLQVPPEVPAGPAEVVLTPIPVGSEERPWTLGDLLASGLAGLWKDRTDIGDSVEFARRLRETAERRRRAPG